MPRRRPTVITVFAILNIVFGSLGLVGILCGGVGLVAGFALLSSVPQQQGGLPVPFPQNVLAVWAVQFGIGFILALVLLSAGIGLLGMRRWARRLSIVYGVAQILMAIAGVVLNLTVIQPAMEQWQRDFQQQVVRAQGPGMPASPTPPSNPLAGTVGSIGGALFGSAYAIALLVVMFLPSVTDALEGRPTRRPEDLDEYEDEDLPRERDRDRERHRDRPWGDEDTGIREP